MSIPQESAPNDWIAGFGAMLRATREAAGLTRSKLARLIDVPEQNVKNWETGRVLPSLPMYWRLQHVLPDLRMPPYRSGKSKRVPRMASPTQAPLVAVSS